MSVPECDDPKTLQAWIRYADARMNFQERVILKLKQELKERNERDYRFSLLKAPT